MVAKRGKTKRLTHFECERADELMREQRLGGRLDETRETRSQAIASGWEYRDQRNDLAREELLRGPRRVGLTTVAEHSWRL